MGARRIVVLVLMLIAVAGCRVRKERIRGKTAIEIQGGSVQVTTETARVRIGRESARVPVPRVHVSTDSGTRTTGR